MLLLMSKGKNDNNLTPINPVGAPVILMIYVRMKREYSGGDVFIVLVKAFHCEFMAVAVEILAAEDGRFHQAFVALC